MVIMVWRRPGEVGLEEVGDKAKMREKTGHDEICLDKKNDHHPQPLLLWARKKDPGA